MRLLFAAQGYPGVEGTGSGSGIGTYVRELTLGLTARGHECHVMVWSEDGRGGEAGIDGVKIHFVQRRHWPILERWWPDARNVGHRGRVATQLDERYGFDWVEIESDEGIDIAIQRRFRGRVHLRVHTTLAQMCREKQVSASRRTLVYLARERRSFQLAERVLVSTHAHANELARCHPELPPAEVIPIGWGAAPEPRVEACGPCPVFLYVGTLDRRKGIDRLLPILSEYSSRYGACELRIISSSPERNIAEFGLDQLPTPVKLSRRTKLSTAELFEEYHRAAAVIHPARYESFGMPLIEAASVGTPVVASPTGIAPELCTGPLSLFLVDMGHFSTVARSLHQAVISRVAVGKEFYRAYAARFTRHQMTESYLQLLHKWAGAAGTRLRV